MTPKRQSGVTVAVAMGLLVLGLVGGCRCASKSGFLPKGNGPNDVDAAALAPKLLHDEAEIAAFVDAFPKDKYKAVESTGVGKFWVDEGTDIIKNELRAGKEWEPHVVKLLREHVKPGTTVLDVGAYVGTHTILMGQLVGKDGRVYAFEPQRNAFRELSQNVLLNGLGNTLALRYAVGSESKVIEMNPTSKGNAGGTSIGHGGDKAELRTLDSFGFKNVSLLKIDVEGYEEGVLDGAKETIARNRPVLVVEIYGNYPPYDQANPEQKAQFDALFAKITALGYEMPKLIYLHDYLVLPKKA